MKTTKQNKRNRTSIKAGMRVREKLFFIDICEKQKFFVFSFSREIIWEKKYNKTKCIEHSSAVNEWETFDLCKKIPISIE